MSASPNAERLCVRLASPPDFDAVGDLTVAAYVGAGYVAANDSYVDVLRDCRRRATEAELWVATDGEEPDAEILGTVTYCPPESPWRELGGPDDGEFRVLAVSPHASGRGVGTALVEHCVELARQHGHRHMVLSTLPAQQPAHRIYERLGFRRDADSDWSPKPGTLLIAYRLSL